MEYRKLKNGYKASLLGFGCMRFPTNQNGKIEEKTAKEMLFKAYSGGVNYFDTAYPYHNGQSEEFVGRAMESLERSSFYFATKLPCWEINSLEDVERIFNKQLTNLRTDYVDFYLLHALNKDRFAKMRDLGVIERLVQKKKEGYIRNLGFSFHDNYDVFKEIIEYRDWDFCQIQFNYMDQNEQATMKGYELAKSLDIPMVIMEPIKGGSLATVPDEVIDPLREFRPNCTAAAWALNWVASFDNVKVILSGMSSIDQVAQNVDTFSQFEPLSKAEMETVNIVAENLNKRVMNGCTACRYCMPCPAGVNIPRNFSIWNEYHKYMNKWDAKWRYFDDMPEAERATNCIKCGKCEQVCPQKLHIRDNLASFAGEMQAMFPEVK